MKVSVILADKGSQGRLGTLSLLNAGWKVLFLNPLPPGIAPITPSFVVAVFFEVDQDHCNHPIDIVLSLVTEDGHPVQVPHPAGHQDLRITQTMTVPSPGGVPIGTPGAGGGLIEIIPGLQIAEGGYRWEVTIDGKDNPDWAASFRVMRPTQSSVSLGGPTPSLPSPEATS